MTAIGVLMLLVIAAGVGIPVIIRRPGPGPRYRRLAVPVTRRPVRAQLELATGLREHRRASLPAGALQRRTEAIRTEPAQQVMVPVVSAPRPMFGYASWDGRSGTHASDFRAQSARIAAACDRFGVTLVDIVREREPQRGRALERPGLGYALESLSMGEAEGLVVADLSRLTRSAAELGRVLQWFLDHDARLIAVGQGLDTALESGRLAIRTIIEISRWEHERLVERTRNGMRAARRKGPPGVADYPQLKERIVQMRAAGMTLEAIAGQLNHEGTPTVRGGTKWRPSSVQVAAGYRRPPAGRRTNSRRDGSGPKPSEVTRSGG
jgi:DNA invertase Pin-like site-specific DNA recombinase